MALFLWGRFRYDVTAVIALLFAVAIGVLVNGGDGAGHAQRGLGHPLGHGGLGQVGEQGISVGHQ